MKARGGIPSLLAVAMLAGGCRTYTYRVVQPPPPSQTIDEQYVTVQCEPLEYRFKREGKRLLMRIVNPTDQRIALLGNNSYVMNPAGESHPLPPQVLAPHGYASLLLPPKPIMAAVPEPPGWGWSWGPGFPTFGPPVYGDFYYGFYYAPPPRTYQLVTPYDWQWGTGTALFHLLYERDGKTFEQELHIVRETRK
jgi:hypothetical protein